MSGAEFLDTTPFFDDDEFAMAATLHRDGVGPAIPATVIFNQPGRDLIADVTSTEFEILYQRSEWPVVEPPRDEIEIQGTGRFRVIRVHSIDDGAIARAWLSQLPTTL